VAMIESRAQRTLVKSPPELWSELSDAESLARHLGEFGEIRITRLEPETAVAWEGESASGTVELQASGWGTKVTLTAVLDQRTETEAEPVVETAPAAVTEPEPVVVPEPVAAPEPVAVLEPAPEPIAAAPAAPEPKRGFFARLFRRSAPVPVAAIPSPIVEPEPTAVTAEPGLDAEPAVAVTTEDLEPAPCEPEAIAPPAAEQATAPQAAPLDQDAAVAALTAVLDDLGAAHHRPFSR
jgi:hypothetical protein